MKYYYKSWRNFSKIQNDFSRRRTRVQKHIGNPWKRHRELKEVRGRQGNRIRGELHKLSKTMENENPDTTFIVEDLNANAVIDMKLDTPVIGQIMTEVIAYGTAVMMEPVSEKGQIVSLS